MHYLLAFFRDASEKRTQFFIVMGFIVIPLLAMIYIFIFLVIDESTLKSQRIKIPQEVLETQQQ